METLTIVRPDDWHLHLRDEPFLKSVASCSAAQFARAMIMPNLQPPVRSCADANAYRQRILDALDSKYSFEPLMSLYLTDNTSAEEVQKAAGLDYIVGAKLYPAGATTNSAAGVTKLDKIYSVLEAMQKHGLILQVHGEATASEVDIFDREKQFIDDSLLPLMHDFPELRIVFEHITTREAVEFVNSTDQRLAATITAHHLLINRNAMFQGGIRPHHYCLPVAKREHHRQALLTAATGNSSDFFAGTDSAPHTRGAKESACGCAGIFSALSAVELYAQAFELTGSFDNFEAFMSINGAHFYQRPINTDTITLSRKSWTVPDSLAYADDVLIPFMAGQTLNWKLQNA